MTDTEIDRRLALAIGYLPEHVQQTLGRMVVVNRPVEVDTELWVEFDHTDYQVAGPIAERFELFPWFNKMYKVWAVDVRADLEVRATTPQRAIALAAIAKLEKK